MNPEEKILENEIDKENEDVDYEEFDNYFFNPTDEEQDLDTEVALAINSLMND